MTNHQRTSQFQKDHVFVSVKSFKHNFVLAMIDTYGHKNIYVGGLTQVSYDKATLITKNELTNMLSNYMVIGFNNKKYEDYMILEIANGSSAEKVNEVSKLIKESKKPIFLIEPKLKSLYATFDVSAAIPNASLLEVASRIGLNISRTHFNYEREDALTEKELNAAIDDTLTDAETIKAVFLLDEVQAYFDQHKAVINRYLPGNEWAISSTDSSLASRAMTDGKKHVLSKEDMKKHFTWELNGHNVLKYIPEEWANAITENSKIYENEFNEYLSNVENGMSTLDAGLLLKKNVGSKSIAFPKIMLGQKLQIQPTYGGLHVHYIDHETQSPVTVQKRNVHHRDISAAYSMLALHTNLFGSLTKNYKKFVDDKFEAKENAKKGIDPLQVPVTKIMTNAPTGEADRPGSDIYNPIAMTENRIMLQILMYLAAKIVVDHDGDVFSINTDGMFYSGNEKEFEPLFEKWENFWNLKLGYENIYAYIGKDDSTRIILNSDQSIDSASGLLSNHKFSIKKFGTLPSVVSNVVIDIMTHSYPEAKKISIKNLTDRNAIPDDLAEKLKDFDNKKAIVDLGLEKELFEETMIYSKIFCSIWKMVKNNDVSKFLWTKKPAKNHHFTVNNKIIDNVNRFMLTTTGDEVKNYNVSTDSFDKMEYFPASTKVTFFNKTEPDVLPNNLNLAAYEELAFKLYKTMMNN